MLREFDVSVWALMRLPSRTSRKPFPSRSWREEAQIHWESGNNQSLFTSELPNPVVRMFLPRVLRLRQLDFSQQPIRYQHLRRLPHRAEPQLRALRDV